MTDKQIIIDGIDVSGCEFYLPHSEKCGCIVDDNGNNNLLCREYRDCYYKRMSHTGQEKDIYKNENKELYNQLKCKEQECEEKSWEIGNLGYKIKHQRKEINIRLEQLDQLKAEVKSKTEYIQEQRDIINQYSKEIEMYKKCQGKRASKREEELKAENKHLNDLLNQALKELEKTRETLTEIKEIAEKIDDSGGCAYGDYDCNNCSSLEQETVCTYKVKKLILQKISEVEDANV